MYCDVSLFIQYTVELRLTEVTGRRRGKQSKKTFDQKMGKLNTKVSTTYSNELVHNCL